MKLTSIRTLLTLPTQEWQPTTLGQLVLEYTGSPRPYDDTNQSLEGNGRWFNWPHFAWWNKLDAQKVVRPPTFKILDFEYNEEGTYGLHRRNTMQVLRQNRCRQPLLSELFLLATREKRTVRSQGVLWNCMDQYADRLILCPTDFLPDFPVHYYFGINRGQSDSGEIFFRQEKYIPSSKTESDTLYVWSARQGKESEGLMGDPRYDRCFILGVDNEKTT